MAHPEKTPSLGPLILGATGQVGRAFRKLAAGGHWPRDAMPVWHGRTADNGIDYVWDMLTALAPRDDRLKLTKGMIVLAGGTGTGTAPTSDIAARLTSAALDLADREGIGPVLVASSQAIYAPTVGPHREDGPTGGTSDYARAKQAVEAVTKGRATALRIGNVAGSDMLLRNASNGPVTLDRFPDGRSPRRCYVGPLTLARICLDLLDVTAPLPDALNIAAPGSVEMADLLAAADLPWNWKSAPEGALPDLRLDLTRLSNLVPLDPEDGSPASLIREARLAGWEGTI